MIKDVCCTVLLSMLCLSITHSVWSSDNENAKSKVRAAEFNSHTPIPDSDITSSTGEGIVKAMLSCATKRYAHGVLGDAIEAGCLIVEDETGAVFELHLPDTQVFEDLVPRIADMNADGQNEVVLVRSDARKGAALAIYSLELSSSGKALTELAATPPIGTANRWLAPVGVADFNDDGAMDIAYVQTPHIGGILKIWSIIDNNFQQIAQSSGYSNHSIGDTRISTASLKDINGDGVMDMALPDQRRKNTVWVTLFPELKQLASVPYNLRDFD